MSKKDQFIVENPWHKLSEFTDARIGLGRAGISVPTQHLLAFQLAHAKAQDAVHLALNSQGLANALQIAHQDDSLFHKRLPQDVPPFILHSQAVDRPTYLQRPDLGRRLNDDAVETLKLFQAEYLNSEIEEPYDLAIVVADGLSSVAIEENCLPFLKAVDQALQLSGEDWKLAPISIVEQGRVALGDEVGELLNANAVLVMIGERPGLSSPDSMGLYLTWSPKVGTLDSSRNCISNVRTAGLNYETAAKKLIYLLSESRRLKLTGVGLKERSQDESQVLNEERKNFLL